MALYTPRAYVLRICASMKHRPRGSRRELVMTGEYVMGRFVSFIDLLAWQAAFDRIQRQYGIESTMHPQAIWPNQPITIDLDAEDANCAEDSTPDAIADQLSVLIPMTYLRDEARLQSELLEGIYGAV